MYSCNSFFLTIVQYPILFEYGIFSFCQWMLKLFSILHSYKLCCYENVCVYLFCKDRDTKPVCWPLLTQMGYECVKEFISLALWLARSGPGLTRAPYWFILSMSRLTWLWQCILWNKNQPHLQAFLILLHLVLLHFAVNMFYKLKVYGSSALSKSIATFFQQQLLTS